MHSDRFGCLYSYMSQHKCIASSKKKICTHKNTSSQLTTDLKKKKKDERWHSSFFHCNEPLRLIAFIRLRNFQLTSPKKKSLYTVWLFANKTPRQPQVGCVSPRSILRHRTWNSSWSWGWEQHWSSCCQKEAAFQTGLDTSRPRCVHPQPGMQQSAPGNTPRIRED